MDNQTIITKKMILNSIPLVHMTLMGAVHFIKGKTFSDQDINRFEPVSKFDNGDLEVSILFYNSVLRVGNYGCEVIARHKAVPGFKFIILAAYMKTKKETMLSIMQGIKDLINDPDILEYKPSVKAYQYNRILE